MIDRPLAMNTRLAFAGMLLALADLTAQPVHAQSTSLRAMLVQPAVADAFADQYGQAIVATFAKILTAEGDAACRKARNLGASEVKRRAGAILVKYGSKLVALQSGRVAEDKLAAKLDELSGPGSAADLRKLSDGKRINQLRAFFRPKFNDNLVDRVANELDHYAAINSRYHGSLNPISSGDMALAMLAADRGIDAETIAKKAFGADKNLERLVDLYTSLIDAYEFATLDSMPLTAADFNAFKGMEVELKALCLPIRD